MYGIYNSVRYSAFLQNHKSIVIFKNEYLHTIVKVADTSAVITSSINASSNSFKIRHKDSTEVVIKLLCYTRTKLVS